VKSEEFATATGCKESGAVANSSLFTLFSSLPDSISQKSFVIKSEKTTA
jgi:hypothetical protein